MKLYYLPGACSLADHIALEWLGIGYETVRLNHADTRSPEFLALNPNGAVPVLVDGDFVLTQNAAILFYLAEINPDARLLGEGTPRARAEVLRWLGFLNSDVHPAFKPIFKPSYFHEDASLATVIVDRARTNIRTYLERLDSRLHDREWLIGTRSIADPYLFVLLRWTLKFEIDTRDLRNLARFFSRMYHDPGVSAAVIAEEGSIIDSARFQG